MFLRNDVFTSSNDSEFEDSTQLSSTQLNTPSASANNISNIISPQAKLEKLKQQKLLQQQKLRGRQSLIASNVSSTRDDTSLISPLQRDSISNTLGFQSLLSPVSNNNGLSDMLRERENEKDNKHISDVEKTMMVHGISSSYDPNENISLYTPQVLSKLDLSDVRNFVTNPAPKAMVECYILRKNDSSMFSALGGNYPVYELYTSDDRFLMAATKRKKNTTSNYLISLDASDLNKNSPNYLGKVRSNFVGTEFSFFDKGPNPDDAAKCNIQPRQELGAALYQANKVVNRGPRKMTVIIPGVREDGNRFSFRPTGDDDSMLRKFEANNLHNCVILQNKPPKWNEQVHAYVLNFNGRVTMASVKNSQLVDFNNPDSIVLQFGKVGKDRFNMDFQSPISPFQALCVCLSSFDSKIACE